MDAPCFQGFRGPVRSSWPWTPAQMPPWCQRAFCAKPVPEVHGDEIWSFWGWYMWWIFWWKSFPDSFPQKKKTLNLSPNFHHILHTEVRSRQRICHLVLPLGAILRKVVRPVNFLFHGRLIFHHCWYWHIGQVKTSTGNNFLENVRECPEIITSTGAKASPRRTAGRRMAGSAPKATSCLENGTWKMAAVGYRCWEFPNLVVCNFYVQVLFCAPFVLCCALTFTLGDRDEGGQISET